MKNYKLLFLLVSLCLFFSSCQDKTETFLVDEILSLEGESQKLAYSMLSGNERHAVWDHKLESILENKSISEAQLNFVLNLKRELRPEYFESNLSERNVQLHNRFRVFEKEAIQLFSKEELNHFFGSLNNVQEFEEQEIEPDDRSCNCNKNASLFCPWTSTCEGIRCNKSDSGCGWFWSDPCDGVCAQVVGL